MSEIKYFYHGSPIQGLKTLKPSGAYATGAPSYVFVSPAREFAACYGSYWNDDTARQGTFDDVLYFALTDAVDTRSPCSLYIVKTNTSIKPYSHSCGCFEYVSEEPLDVCEEIRYSTFREMLIANNVNLITIDEYERMLRMLDM